MMGRHADICMHIRDLLSEYENNTHGKLISLQRI
jgi:hypothetical protein